MNRLVVDTAAGPFRLLGVNRLHGDTAERHASHGRQDQLMIRLQGQSFHASLSGRRAGDRVAPVSIRGHRSSSRRLLNLRKPQRRGLRPGNRCGADGTAGPDQPDRRCAARIAPCNLHREHVVGALTPMSCPLGRVSRLTTRTGAQGAIAAARAHSWFAEAPAASGRLARAGRFQVACA